MPQPTIRPIQEEDWATILALQAEAYYALEPEDQSVLRSKHRLGPTSCLVACRGSEVIGYCLAHPWSKEEPASLYHCYAEPKGHTSLYIHDMVVVPSARGKGIARSFLTQLEQLACQRQQPEMSLVAVQGADRYWSKVGFRSRALAKSLRQYGEQAVYMWRPVMWHPVDIDGSLQPAQQ